MKSVTRQGIFETNSSSTHSLSIAGGEYAPDGFPIQNGKCCVYPAEFGWEEDRHYDAATKASYCLVYAKTAAGDRQTACETMLRDVLTEATGKPVRFISDPPGVHIYEWGYIDHQSSDVCAEAFASKETLRDFIFDPASVLITDNDNH